MRLLGYFQIKVSHNQTISNLSHNCTISLLVI